MLNTKKLLYILPDVAYLTELLPGKKPSTFEIQSFRQINGEYMDDNEFIAENILKLFNKIDPEEYQLILPDFLFTNTIISVQEKSDAKIKDYLSNKLLPGLDLSTDTHQIDTTVLTEHGDSTKVQLSALEKSLLEPIQVSAAKHNIKIKSISPLSWSIKSLISLEPSISVVQMGNMLYIALHYIGVDQASQATVEDVDNIFETIKTLKGAEPSIQTIYLLSNELVEEKLKEHLSDTLPIQQLASNQDDEAKMPSYVQKIIETSMKTLSISDYPVPQFNLGKAPAGATIKTDDKKEEKPDEDKTGLPKPSKAAKASKPVKEEEASKDSQAEDDEIEALLESLKTDDSPKKEEVVPEEKAVESKTEIKEVVVESKAVEEPKKIIKNKNKTKSMLKMVFVTLAVFFATVGIGIGIGLGVLQVTKPKTTPEESAPTAVSEATPTPEPTPTPTPVPELDRASLSILVVNATIQAGYAGEIADLATAAEFGTVKAGNAKGDYKKGNFVLMTEEDQALIDALEAATELKLEFKAQKETEDAKNSYDAVIVLAE